MTHLIRDGSDHAPQHVVYKTDQVRIKKPFRFLNFWCSHHSFMEFVKKAWEVAMEGAPFKVLHEKLKRMKMTLGAWSKTNFGNIFQIAATMEDMVKVKELQLELDLSGENRAELRKLAAELRKF